jgi:hypothetical protein
MPKASNWRPVHGFLLIVAVGVGGAGLEKRSVVEGFVVVERFLVVERSVVGEGDTPFCSLFLLPRSAACSCYRIL